MLPEVAPGGSSLLAKKQQNQSCY